jgi:hypothetical protein
VLGFESERKRPKRPALPQQQTVDIKNKFAKLQSRVEHLAKTELLTFE